MDTIVKIMFGSHLYGTDTPDSDRDYKGIFLPTKENLMLGEIPKSHSHTTGQGHSKNTNEDIDIEIYSLHYFIELACKGETVALDMLHAPDNMIIEKTEIWDRIVADRDRFYTKNLKSFVGYARKQASKYGVKGSRLNDSKRVLDFLKSTDGDKRLKEVWDELPKGEHIHFLPENKNGIREYEVCGRKLQETTTVNYTKSVIQLFYDNYGARAVQAATNQGIDWKAISHALRAAMQVKEILSTGTIIFPLKECDYLKKVKLGKLDYLSEVAPKLENLMDELELLSKKSDLPEKVDRKYWNNFLTKEIENALFK